MIKQVGPIEYIGPSEEEIYRQRMQRYKMRFEMEMEEEDPEYLTSKEYKESEEKLEKEDEIYIKTHLRKQ